VRNGHWALSLALVSACGGRHDPGPAISSDQLADGVAEAFCSSIESCCRAAGFPYDAMACRRTQASVLAPLVDGMRMASGVRYDPHAAFQCIETVRTRACSFFPSLGGGPCDHMFDGLRKPGESCSRHDECMRAREGITLCELAQNGSICTVGPDALTARRGKSGDPCFTTCREWTYGGGTSSACSLFPPLKSGAACYWNDGVYCNFTTAICTTLEPIGARCGDINQCAKGTYCNGDSFGGGVCTAEVGIGGDCSAITWACGDPLYCDQRVCRSRKAVGEDCSRTEECSDSPCDEGKCAGAAPVLASVCAGHM
jgi:hypothetical protein